MTSLGLTADRLDVRSPFDGRVVDRVPRMGALETGRAISAAEHAMHGGLAAHERAASLDRVTVNESPTFRADHAPYGGVEGSGTTREGPAWAVREMSEERLVVIGSQRRRGA